MRTWKWLVLCSVVAFAALAACPTLCLAQKAPPSLDKLDENQQRELSGLLDVARSSYDRKEYTKSLKYFKEAYELFPHPDILYRIALSHQGAGNKKEALRYYKQFLREKPDSSERANVERRVAELEKGVKAERSKLVISTQPEGATVFINDISNGAAGYTPTELPYGPGSYKVIIKKPGYKTVERYVEVQPGQALDVNIRLEKATSAAEEGDLAPNGRNTAIGTTTQVDSEPSAAVFWLIVGGAVASYTFATVAYLQWGSIQTELESIDLNRQSTSRQEAVDLQRASDRWLIGAVSGALVGSALAIWALALRGEVQTTTRRSQLEPPGGISPWVGAEGAGVEWKLRF